VLTWPVRIPKGIRNKKVTIKWTIFNLILWHLLHTSLGYILICKPATDLWPKVIYLYRGSVPRCVSHNKNKTMIACVSLLRQGARAIVSVCVVMYLCVWESVCIVRHFGVICESASAKRNANTFQSNTAITNIIGK